MSRQKSLEKQLLSHLDAAYNLARWLTRQPESAEDLVHDAYIKAFAGIKDFRGEEPKAWLLTIVRNTCYTWLKKNSAGSLQEYQEPLHDHLITSPNSEFLLLQNSNQLRVRTALESISNGYREILILREFEELSYEEISNVMGIPIGTVMSRLSRAREALKETYEKE